MNYSKHIKKFISVLISNYATFNKVDGCYSVDISKLPESELEEFATYMMDLYPALACEATGLDNPDYENYILPSLRVYLMNPNNKDNEIEYLRRWREGVSSYFKNMFAEFISYELEDFNMENSTCAA